MKNLLIKTFVVWLSEVKNVKEEEFNEFASEEMAELYNQYNDYTREEYNKALESKADKSDIEELLRKRDEIQLKQMENLNNVLKEQGLAIAKINTPEGGSEEANTLKQALLDNKDAINALKGEDRGKVNFTIKAPGTMTFTSNVSGGNIPVEDRLEGFNVIATRRTSMLDVVSTRNTNANVVSWVYQANKDGSTGGTAEGATKNQIDFDLVVANEAVKKRSNFIKVSDEMLDDITWLEGEINTELLKELLLDVEGQVYSGDNTGANLNGIATVAPAFSPTAAFATAVETPNIVDVIVASVDQIEAANQDAQNLIAFLNPSVVNKLLTEKVTATDKRYVDRLTMVGQTLMIDGTTRIIKSTLIPSTDFLVGDFSKALLVSRQSVDIQMGLDADDFTKNLKTIRAEWRGLNIVKNNDRSAFVKGVIATAITAITKP